MSKRTLMPVILNGGPEGSYAVNFTMSLDENYILTAQLIDQDGNALGDEQTVDLPLESVVVGGSYDSQTQSIILTLDNGNEITIPVSGLVSGLQPTIDANNKLNADYIADGTNNKVYTAAEQSKLSGIEAGAEVNVQADWTESDSGSDSFILHKPTLGTMAAESASDYTPTASLGSMAFANTSDYTPTASLATVATSGSYSDLTSKPDLSGYRNVIEMTDLTQAQLADFYTNYATLITQNTYVINGYSFTVSPYKYEYQPGVELLILMSNVAGTVLPTNVYPLGGEMTLNCDLYYLAPNGVLQKDTDNDEFALVTRSQDGSIEAWDSNNQTIVSPNGITINGNSVATTNQIPTVNDSTITIQQNGTTVGSFTTNDSQNQTINLTGGSGGGNQWFGTQNEFDNLSTYDENTDYFIKDKIDYRYDISHTPNLNKYAIKSEVDSKNLEQDVKIATLNGSKFITQQEYDNLTDKQEGVNYFIEGNAVEMVVTFTDQSTATYYVMVD